MTLNLVSRLREELYRSTMSFDEELALLHKEGNEAVAFEMMRRGMLTPEAADYATKVDHLHRQVKQITIFLPYNYHNKVDSR